MTAGVRPAVIVDRLFYEQHRLSRPFAATSLLDQAGCLIDTWLCSFRSGIMVTTSVDMLVVVPGSTSQHRIRPVNRISARSSSIVFLLQ